MSPPLESTDYLPQIDAPLPDTTRTPILTHIHSILPAEASSSSLHPLVPSSYQPNFPSWLQREHDRLAQSSTDNGKPPSMGGIDLTRYEADALEPPPRTTPTSDEDHPEILQRWRDTLSRAYATATYLAGRQTNLGLLETYGRNAWLVGNAQMEDVLRELEREVEAKRTEVGWMEEARREEGETVRRKVEQAEREWKKGVREMVEVQVAAEELRMKVLEKRRAAARSQG
jgi:pre-mRNA-splicing factor SPF27